MLSYIIDNFDPFIDEYFSVPLTITRRKLADLRDSIVSSVWRPNYKKALRTYPDFNLIDLDFAIPHCDACNLGGRMSKLVGRCSGEPYDQKAFQVCTSEHIFVNTCIID